MRTLKLDRRTLPALAVDILLQVGPELVKGIRRHAAHDAFRRPQKRIARIGFARDSPGIRNEISADDS